MSNACAPAWFHNAVVDGVMLLHSLALAGSPAAEVVTLTASGWIEVLWRSRAWAATEDHHHQAADAGRLRQAFYALAQAVDRWPAPRQLCDHLPNRPAPVAIARATAPITPERRALLAATLRRITDHALSHPSGRREASATPGVGAAGLYAPGVHATLDGIDKAPQHSASSTE